MTPEKFLDNYNEIDLLEKHQQSVVFEMRRSGADLDHICESFIRTSAVTPVHNFGGSNQNFGIAYESVKKEFYELLCGEKYMDERKRIYESRTHKAFTLAISAKLATIFTIHAIAIYPVVVLFLPVIRKVGCESYKNFSTELKKSK